MADSKVEVSNSMDKLSAAINYFGLKLHLLLAKGNENVFFSPFSISVALSMLYRGTKEETAVELEQALGFEYAKLCRAEVHDAFNQMLSLFLQDHDSYLLNIANAVISQKGFVLLSDYKEDLRKIYRALAMEVDFITESTSAVKQINDWVDENTKGKISKLFDSLDPSTVMVLLNAVYFKGTWQYQFDKNIMYNGQFYNYGIEAQAKEVPLMYVEEKFYFVEKESYKVLELPYIGDDIAMLILLPSEKNGLAKLENKLTVNFLRDVRNELFKTKVEVTIPKLHLEYSKELKPVLIELGVNAVFDDSANLKGLSECERLKVSEVMHKAVLDVNEEGSEAAAVTAVTVVCYSALVVSVPEFKADHPFLFMIYDKKLGLILFMGRVEKL